MATLAISSGFLSDYAKLERALQAKVSQLASTFQQMTAQELRDSGGIHLERHTKQRDPRARTIRIDSNHRGIVLDAGDDDLYILCLIDTHQNTDRWMAKNEFKVNEATGALEISDPVAIAEVVQATTAAVTPARDATKLYDHREDKHFRQLGVAEALIPALRAFTDQDELLGILEVVPPRQADALMLLLGDESVDLLYGQIAPDTKPENVDPEDLVAAVATAASKAEFFVLAEQDDLQDMLAQPLAKWRTYLHPSQELAAYQPVYSGPARVTGGAGTGKTVVAMHRAKFLADGLEHTGPTKPILFTTFTANLADSIERDLRSLGGAELLDKVEVLNVDKLANRIVTGAEGSSPGVIGGPEIEQLFSDAIDEFALDYSPEFLRAEFDQVVLAQDCRSRSDYFSADRAGRGIRLDRRARAGVWKALEFVTQELATRSRRTYLQIASDAAGYLASKPAKRYRHVIVDEAQDLHESQWRLLRAAVGEQDNDMFIVGDSHQRIYDRRTSLSKVGIKIVGRSRRLRINYRTTHEILRWSLAFLGEVTFDDLDGGSESQTLAEYHSYLHGDDPVMADCESKQAELQALHTQVKSWIDGGVAPEDIAVTARTSGSLDDVARLFGETSIEHVRLGSGLPSGPGVRLGTMHRLKGTEYRAVAMMDMDDLNVPLQWAVTSKSADTVQHNADLQRERCTAYVAATRAREFLWVGWSGRPSPFLVDNTEG